ncbi:MAG: hypothetical protein H5T92_05460 [Synergistales bacterium]|nr:hypothetical protein [Synergistales bacterium]
MNALIRLAALRIERATEVLLDSAGKQTHRGAEAFWRRHPREEWAASERLQN